MNSKLNHFNNVRGYIILAGDFNVPGVNWSDLSLGRTNLYNGEALLDLMFSLNLVQVVKDISKSQDISHSTLDLAFLSDTLYDRGYQYTVSDGISDHKIITLTLPVGNMRNFELKVITPPQYQKAANMSIIDYLEVSLEKLIFDGIGCERDAEHMWLYFLEIVKG